MSERYYRSEKYLERSLKSIPLGSQTFSKSITQYAVGTSPLYITKGKGSQVWDLDGNQYTDFVGGLCSILLGYCDPDVNTAVESQLKDGSIFSLPHPIETEVAELLQDCVPGAELIRFGKNGSDATSAAIRLARAYTGRDHIAICGYHGWQDWYIGSTPRNLGVPLAVQKLTHSFAYNNLTSLEDIFAKHQLACVIMEPMNIDEPKNDFLHKVKALCAKNGSLFVLDETITGFRFSLGGAQEYFDIQADLVTLGKGLANGFPLSAIVGRRDIMKLMEDIFFSTTFAGDTLALAAAKATIQKIKNHDVPRAIRERGNQLKSQLSATIQNLNLNEVFEVKGHPSWNFLTIKSTSGLDPWVLKSYIMQELFKFGFLSLGTHNMCYSHQNKDIEGLIEAYHSILSKIDGDVENKLEAPALKPLFRVRP